MLSSKDQKTPKNKLKQVSEIQKADAYCSSP